VDRAVGLSLAFLWDLGVVGRVTGCVGSVFILRVFSDGGGSVFLNALVEMTACPQHGNYSQQNANALN